AGLKFANGQSVGVRAIHYSNAGLKQPNDGIESYSLFYKIPI
ncbi:TPA: acyloxyacyl hydrolase, partial [Pseudomonas aeruginosa]